MAAIGHLQCWLQVLPMSVPICVSNVRGTKQADDYGAYLLNWLYGDLADGRGLDRWLQHPQITAVGHDPPGSTVAREPRWEYCPFGRCLVRTYRSAQSRL